MWPFGKNAKERLEDALDDQELTAKLDLDVKVENKTAKVSGEVPNERYKNLIKAIAGGISGIEDVDLSALVFAKGAAGRTGKTEQAGSERAADPSALAKAALKKIKGEASLANNPLDVLQRGSSVVLRGAVDSQAEFEKAKALAASVDGVTDVDVGGLQVIANASELNVTDAEGDIVYTVKSGDTLSHIALKYYGDAGKGSYMKIAEANAISDPDKIRVGQQLKIPGTTKGPDAVLV